MTEPKLEVARITRPHGVRGALKVELHWVSSPAFELLDRLALVLADGRSREVEITSRSHAGRHWIMTFAGVNDRDAAQALVGARIMVERAALPALEEGEAYLVDLVGASVEAPDGVVGEVIEVRAHPSVDSLVIRCADGRLVEQPLIPVFIEQLDSKARRIRLANRDGLIE